MATASLTVSLQYSAPGGNTPVAQFQVTTEYTASAVGVIDIPDATAAETEFEVPFGSIENALAVVIRNTNNQELGIRIGAAEADEFTIAPGAFIVLGQPTEPSSVPLTALAVTTTAEQAGAGGFEYIVLGDAPEEE